VGDPASLDREHRRPGPGREHSARADLLRRLGRTAEAREAYERALTLARQEPERRFLERRMGE
ncbi:MAG TPA: tetratricopeptide repeat protein, partial [Longimicrobium sp.]|nr:tetratricopeptide repeat protein [Longimicrobium sp.]